MRVAVVTIDAASEPEPGSVVASEVIGVSAPASGVSHARFCSSVPSSMTGSAKKPFEQRRLPMPRSPTHSSSWTRTCVNTSVNPPPPYSSGSMKPVMPTFAAARHRSQGVSTSASSTARPRGRISSRANVLVRSTMSRCSGVRGTSSMGSSDTVPPETDGYRRGGHDRRGSLTRLLNRQSVSESVKTGVNATATE